MSAPTDTPKKPARKKAAAKTETPKATKTAAKKTVKGTEGGVLQALSLKQILDFTGGTMDTVIDVSKRSLVDAKTANQREAAKSELAKLSDLSDL